MASLLLASPHYACGPEPESLPFTLEVTATPALADAPANLGAGGSLAMREEGTLLALTGASTSATQVHLFDGDGAYLRSIGVAGAGPTEYRSIAALGFDASDSLWVFDEGNRRVDVYGPDLSMTRTVPFEGRVRGVVAWPAGGMLVVSVVGGGPGDRTLRVDRIEGEDRVPVHRQTVGADPSEGLAVAADAEGVFLVDRRSHSLTRVDGAGEVTSLAEEAPGWWDFDPVEEELSTMMDVRPGVRSVAVREGEVWILSSAVRPPADAMSVLQDPELSPNQRMAAVNGWITNGIQVLDASTGEPLRTYRFEGAPVYFLDDRFAYRWEAADDESMVPLRLVVGRY